MCAPLVPCCAAPLPNPPAAGVATYLHSLLSSCAPSLPPCPPLHRLVPIVYTSEVSWQQELWRLLPTILLIGGYVWFTRRQMGGLGGGGGPGGRGIFNVGKASVRGCPLGCRAAQFMAGPGHVECRWLCRKRRQAALAGRWTGLLPHL